MRTNDFILDWGSERSTSEFVEMISSLTDEQGKKVDLDPAQVELKTKKLFWTNRSRYKNQPIYHFIDNNDYVIAYIGR